MQRSKGDGRGREKEGGEERERDTPLSVIFIRGVKHSAPEADAHDAEIRQVAQKGIFPAAVHVDAVQCI